MSLGTEFESFYCSRGSKRIRLTCGCQKYSNAPESEVKEERAEQAEEASLSTQVFRIPMILKQILECLPIEQLLQTALVNKNWNFFSREILCSEERSLANLVFSHSFLIYLKLNELEKTENIPFNGLTVELWDEKPPEYQRIEIGQKLGNFLSNVTLKYLTITDNCGSSSPLTHGGSNWRTSLLRRIIKSCMGSLEGITIDRLSNNMRVAQIFGFGVEELKFTNLKFLRFPALYSHGVIYNHAYYFKTIGSNLVKKLLKVCPNVQKIYGTWPTKSLESLTSLGLANTVEDFLFQPLVDPLDLALQFALGEPNLKQLAFSSRIMRDEEGDVVALHNLSEPEIGKIAQIMRLLLTSSQNSLKTLSANNFDLLIMAHKWDMPPMISVTELHLNEVVSDDESGRGNVVLRKLEWAKHFPHLSTVFVRDDYVNMMDFDQYFYVNEAAHGEMSVRHSCKTVSKVIMELYHGPLMARDASYLANNLFPHVKTLQIDYYFEACENISPELHNHLNFKLWKDLEKLVLKFKKYVSSNLNFNMDALLLGVNGEEAKFLSENIQLDQLDSLKLVRNYTGLLDFPGLKKLEIYLNLGLLSADKLSNLFFITRLISSCVLPRIPELRMEIIPKKSCLKWDDFSASVFHILQSSAQITVKGLIKYHQDEEDSMNSNNLANELGFTVEAAEDPPSFEDQVFSMLLKRILEYVPKQQLLETALVNKCWNLASREVLRSSENKLACLEVKSPYQCEKIIELVQDAENCPYNGLRIFIYAFGIQEERWKQVIEEIPGMLRKMIVKYLTIDFYYCVSDKSNNDQKNLIREILIHSMESLEGLTFEGRSSDLAIVAPFFGSNIQGLSFPNLKILRFPSMFKANSRFVGLFPTSIEFNRVSANLLWSLLEAFPNIQKIDGTLSPAFLKPLLILKASTMMIILEEFYIQPSLDSLDLMLRLALEGGKLKRLIFPTGNQIFFFGPVMCRDYSPSRAVRLTEIVKCLLKNSEDTLNTFCASILELLLIAHVWKVPALKSVTKLHFNVYSNPRFTCERMSYLEKLDWETYFPHLKTVQICYDFVIKYRTHFHVNMDVGIAESSGKYSCATVSEIIVEANQCLRPSREWSFALNLFPNVKMLQVCNYYELNVDGTREFQNHFYFPSWTKLETFVVRLHNVTSMDFNIDAYLLGVNREEARFILENIDTLTMDSLEIVRHYPGLLDFTKLKKLEIHLDHNSSLCKSKDAVNNSFCMSRLIPLWVFARLPDLKIDIYRDTTHLTCLDTCPFLLRHLEPFAQQITLKCRSSME